MAAKRRKPRLEHSLLYTATLCLLAFGAVMVYSASSAESLLAGTGDASYYLKRYLAFAVVGVVVGAQIAHVAKAATLRRVVAWALLSTGLLIAAQTVW